MSMVQDHYESMLADHYTWLYAEDFDQKVREQSELLRRAGAGHPRVALDLGCGSGFQTLALHALGARRVLAVDTSAQLLAELERRMPQSGIELLHRDITEFGRFVSEPIDTVVCMGDTLTHLEERRDVTRLFEQIASCVDEGGRFVLGYRDLSMALEGLDRFIPLRSGDDKIMTCFLERDADRVLVHDLIHLRGANGWELLKSAYPKLILPIDEVCEEVAGFGFELAFRECTGGLHTLGLVRR